MKKIVLTYLLTLLFNLGLFSSVQAQGCIAVRHMARATGWDEPWTYRNDQYSRSKKVR
ncbi:MAG: hypothetical protein IPI18_09940 [Saprospiraceae bacterium]|nr:hypothetical protein [Saprospiraceae bacterium]